MADMRAPRSGHLRADGRWTTTITLTDYSGAKICKTLYASSPTELKEAVKKFVREHEDGRPKPEMSIERFLDIWLEHKKPKIKEKTFKGYSGAVETHLKKHLGSKRLVDLTAADVEKMTAKIGEKRIAAVAREILRNALRFAQKNRWVSDNAAALADPPKVAKRIRPVILREELNLVLIKESSKLFRSLWLTLAETGLRPIEARNLQFGEILKEKDGHWIALQDSKTEVGKQPIPISNVLASELLSLRDRSIFVFANPVTGRPYDETCVREKWVAALVLAGVEYRNLYQLRKLFGREKAKRVPDHVLKRLMRHTDVRTTKQFYLDAEAKELRESVGE